MKTIGQKISPILEEIEDTLWEFEATKGIKPNFTDKGFRAATKIFASILMDKMYELQVNENIDLQDKMSMAKKVGNDIRKIVKTYTNIDTHLWYK